MDTKEKIKVMQASVDGEQIQSRNAGTIQWMDNNSPLWCWEDVEYRIKPEKPREIYVNLYYNKDSGKTWYGDIRETEAEALEVVSIWPRFHDRLIKFREVQD